MNIMGKNFLLIMDGVSVANKRRGGQGLTGGVIRAICIAQQLKKLGFNVGILTSKAGKEVCEKFDLSANYYMSSYPYYYSILTVFRGTLGSVRLPAGLKDYEGTVYSTTEHIYNVIPAVRLKWRNRNKLVVVAHWVAPIKRTGTSVLNGILYFINQRLGYLLIKKYADVVLAVSDSTAESLAVVGIAKDKIKSVKCGIDFTEIRAVSVSAGEPYDAIFMKHFSATKGIFDVIDIWEQVVKSKPEAKLGLIGTGTESTIEKLEQIITEKDLEDNIDIIGPIYDFKKKFSLLAGSKLFLLPSYEENWAIVIGEALAAGLPVICYDLPEIRPIWGNHAIWVPIGDTKKFATEVVELLSNDKKRKTLSEEGIKFVRKFDWENIAKEELSLIFQT